MFFQKINNTMGIFELLVTETIETNKTYINTTMIILLNLSIIYYLEFFKIVFILIKMKIGRI